MTEKGKVIELPVRPRPRKSRPSGPPRCHIFIIDSGWKIRWREGCFATRWSAATAGSDCAAGVLAGFCACTMNHRIWRRTFAANSAVRGSSARRNPPPQSAVRHRRVRPKRES